MAVAALAACTKSEVEYTNLNEISIAPVASNVTKSVAGYEGNAFDGKFPTDIDLYVFANAVEGTYSSTNAGSPYFQNAQFEWKAGIGTTTEVENIGAPNNKTATAGAYAGNPTRYWPNVKTLVFAGYSDACNVASLSTKPTMNFSTNKLTITGYTQDNTKTEEGANDLMWFACDETEYSKQANEVIAKMQHACSWITINVKGDASTKGKWILNSLVVTNFAHTGTATCGTTAATWDSYSKVEPEDYYNAQTTSTFNPQQGTTFTDQYVEYYKTKANNFIVIPQVPTTLEVTYSYKSDTDIWFHETKVISLDYDGADGTNTKWQSGVHYIYNLTITATEILIDPVAVNWTTGTTPDTTI